METNAVAELELKIRVIALKDAQIIALTEAVKFRKAGDYSSGNVAKDIADKIEYEIQHG